MQKLSLAQILERDNTQILEIFTPSENILFSNEVLNFVTDNFKLKSRNKDLITDVECATRQMIANAIEHGNKSDSSKKIKVYCSWVGKGFYFVVQDEGKGFDVENPPAGDPEYGGLGLHYTKKMMDLVYNFNDSAVYLCKKRKGFFCF